MSSPRLPGLQNRALGLLFHLLVRLLDTNRRKSRRRRRHHSAIQRISTAILHSPARLTEDHRPLPHTIITTLQDTTEPAGNTHRSTIPGTSNLPRITTTAIIRLLLRRRPTIQNPGDIPFSMLRQGVIISLIVIPVLVSRAVASPLHLNPLLTIHCRFKL